MGPKNALRFPPRKLKVPPVDPGLPQDVAEKEQDLVAPGRDEYQLPQKH